MSAGREILPDMYCFPGDKIGALGSQSRFTFFEWRSNIQIINDMPPIRHICLSYLIHQIEKINIGSNGDIRGRNSGISGWL